MDKMLEEFTQKLMVAVKDYQVNPEKAEAYITRRVSELFKAGVEIGKEAIKDELFNGE